jgi:predicted ATPase
VVGRVFWWGAVSHLTPPDARPRVGSHLQSLTRKDLIEPARSDLPDEDAFRFGHILLVDAAYSSIPKSVRADLHEIFAGWVETKLGDRGREYDEIIAYHLEQAYRALADLGETGSRTHALGARAAQALAAAGRRAFTRGDMPAAVNLLSRAASLSEAGDHTRLEVLPELAFALLETGDACKIVLRPNGVPT